MAFWSQASTEPKRAFRYLLYFTGCPQFVVSKVNKPGFTVGSQGYQFLNYEFKYPGRVTWDDITMTIVDPVQPDSTFSLYKILKESGYTIPSSYAEGAAKTIGKGDMVKSLGSQIRIWQIDHAGNKIEEWVLHNPLIKSVKFGELDYSQETLLNITMTLSIDWATIEEIEESAAGAVEGKTWTLNKVTAQSAQTGFTLDDTGTITDS